MRFGDYPQLVVGHRRAVFVAVFFRNRQRQLVPAFRRRIVALRLGDSPQLVVGTRRAVFVAVFFIDRERLLVPAFRRRIVALRFGDYPQLVVCPCFPFVLVDPFTFSSKIFKQAACACVITGVLGISGETLGQGCNIRIHAQGLRQCQRVVEVAAMQDEGEMLFVQVLRCELVCKAAHKINEGALPCLTGRMPAAQVVVQGGVHPVDVLPQVVQQSGGFQRGETIGKLWQGSGVLCLLQHGLQIISVNMLLMQPDQLQDGHKHFRQALVENAQCGENPAGAVIAFLPCKLLFEFDKQVGSLAFVQA